MERSVHVVWWRCVMVSLALMAPVFAANSVSGSMNWRPGKRSQPFFIATPAAPLIDLDDVMRLSAYQNHHQQQQLPSYSAEEISSPEYLPKLPKGLDMIAASHRSQEVSNGGGSLLQREDYPFTQSLGQNNEPYFLASSKLLRELLDMASPINHRQNLINTLLSASRQQHPQQASVTKKSQPQYIYF
ncbi:uncharacterized protein LOC142335206 [Convolutriloba macropyga]|uniref:uncharacterized protein LOC142335206 n=1 Tax=Convolutriloba macropyga TaxID=536237 RepID=UPI003F527191